MTAEEGAVEAKGERTLSRCCLLHRQTDSFGHVEASEVQGDRSRGKEKRQMLGSSEHTCKILQEV